MRINTNMAALNSHRMLQNSSISSAKNLEKLSSGKRINRASDDAAGLAISEKMNAQINANTGTKTFDLPTSLSLMVFYAFAMQCMSTLAVVYRETKGWKWPLIISNGLIAVIQLYHLFFNSLAKENQ